MANVIVSVWLSPTARWHPGAEPQGPESGVTSVSPAGVVSVTTTLSASEGPRLVTTIVYVILVPGDAVGGPVFVRLKSASAVSAMLADGVLFAGLRSGTPAGVVTVAVFERVPGGVFAGSAPVTVNVAPPPTGRLTLADSAPTPAAGQEEAPAFGTHVHRIPVSAGVVPGSVTVAPLTALGPALATTIR